MENKNCIRCGKELDNPQDPSSRDCGGDCVECMAEAGDPDCQQEMYGVLKARLAVSEANVAQLLNRSNDSADDIPRFLLVRNGQPVLNNQQQVQFFTFGRADVDTPTPVMFQHGLPVPEEKQQQVFADFLGTALRR